MKYKLSVRLMTYMHSDFIDQAMKGILEQKIDFPIEIVVGDDFSDDDTLDKIKEYSGNEKIHIKILNRKIGDPYWTDRQKYGRLHNFKNIVDNCNGEYIALLDGDDSWINTDKLRKQVDFLDKNPEFNLVGHYAKAINIDTKTTFISGCHDKDIYTHVEIAHKNLRIPTSSIVFRNNVEIPNWFYKIYGGDRALIYLNSIKGKLKIMDFVGSLYNVHNGGIEQNFKGSKTDLAYRNITEDLIYYNEVEPKDSKRKLKRKIIWNLMYASIWEFKSLNFNKIFRNIGLAFKLKDYNQVNLK